MAAESFGQRIQRLRHSRGLTQRQVASQLGIDFTYLSKLENDRGEPPGEDTIRKLAALLETDEEMLLATAGKVPAGLRDRARNDVEFARFLRRLASIPDSEMREIYEKLGISDDRPSFAAAMREERRDCEQERLARVSRCPQCGRSANGAEWDLLSNAQAMNAALRQVRWLAEAAGPDGIVPAARILAALDVPYRFPLPDAHDPHPLEAS